MHSLTTPILAFCDGLFFDVIEVWLWLDDADGFALLLPFAVCCPSGLSRSAAKFAMIIAAVPLLLLHPLVAF